MKMRRPPLLTLAILFSVSVANPSPTSGLNSLRSGKFYGQPTSGLKSLKSGKFYSQPTSGLKSLKSGKFYSQLNCTLCQLGVDVAKGLLSLHVSKDFIAKRLLDICEAFQIEDKPVCQGVVSEFKDELLTVLSKTSLSAADTCVLMFGSICSSSAYDPEIDWTVSFPDKVKAPPHHTEPTRNSPKLRILQLADIHVDEYYAVGANTDCGEPICCQTTNGHSKIKSSGAGYWGDFRHCDIPERTLDNLFAHLAKNEQFDMIYWTGDLPAHNIWAQSRGEQVALLQRLTDKLLRYFKKTPVYSAVGNHESAPVDSFPPPFVTGNRSESWLYNTLAKTWSPWLPGSTTDTIKYGAFYTVKIKSGFRIISINTNYCDHMNWWLLLNSTDPAQELKWLIKILQTAEDNEEKVHIIGHIPPGDSTCYRVWSRNYGRIVVRYADTIAAQFFSHTHFDHFELFYEPTTKKPVSVGYIGPSVTTYSEVGGLNPAYRIYTVDGFYANSTWGVLDHDTVAFDLTLANTKNITTWQHEYSAKSVYGLPDLSPHSWHQFTHNLQTNDTAFSLFYNYYYKMNPPATCKSGACRDSIICALRTATYGDNRYCSTTGSAAGV